MRRDVLLPDDVWTDLRRESARQDRTPSWLVMEAWKIAVTMHLTHSKTPSMDPAWLDDRQ